MTDRKRELAEESIGKLLVRYSVPAMVGLFVHALYNVVDTIFVGQGAGTLALAGLAICFPIQMIIMSSAIAVGIGTASVVSRSLGAKDQRRAERAAGTSYALAIVIGLTFMLTGWATLEPLLKLFGAQPAVLPYAKEYLSTILIGTVFLSVAICSHNVARAEGAVRVATASMIVGAVVNLILDPIFIFDFGFGMGIRGAAVATVIANFTSFAFITLYFARGKSMLRIRLGDLWPDLKLLPGIFAIGGVTFFSMVAGNVIAIPINQTIGMFENSEVHLAIMGVINRSMMFFMMPIYGLVQGFLPIAGFNYGAGDIARVTETLKKATLYATVLSVSAFLILAVGTKPLLGVFSNDPKLIELGAPIMRIVVMVMPFVGLQMLGGGYFQALGKARPAFLITLLRQVFLLIPLVLILPRMFGLYGLWFSFPIADFTATVITVWWLVRDQRALAQNAPRPVEWAEEPVT